ncbi:T6SS phospholipase effector Tle1-like catalytic domain-containing protein [Variovorax boronicumulans]|uniref:T6SS phospholipase effector Tle1-like catalytic domain-containing protein n=1 Tax=Variovorax boronicumulans TaxID=436515 RepID=UPI001C582303
MSQFKTALESATVGCPRPLPSTNPSECEFTLNIGLFFDGTDNNSNVQKEIENPSLNTNVARLSVAYRNAPMDGGFKFYVSGVGTPFTEIEELEAPMLGSPAGAGGEERIVYGLLQVLNAVHRFVNGDKARFGLKQLAALCSRTTVPIDGSTPTAPQAILADLGLGSGLIGHSDLRARFIRTEAARLAQQVQASARPKIKAIYLDVFGFSRGAAQARVFVTWLHELLLGQGQLFGVPSYVRMLGLFDTVSSVGLTNAFGASGHSDWALARDLPIHAAVKNCVHYVALHELRANFPCDSVGVGPGGVIPTNCDELFYPGAHSDVGGGYAAGEQGKGVRSEWVDPRVPPSQGGMLQLVRDDGLRLSQLPLNNMYTAARRTCVGHESAPWIALDSAEADQLGLAERFAMATNGVGVPLVRKAVTDYLVELSGVTAGLTVRDALRAHGLRYLAWRWRVNMQQRFEQLPSVERAGRLSDPSLVNYRKGERIFDKQVRLLSTRAPVLDLNLTGDKDVRNGFSPHAQEIFEQMRSLKVGGDLERFFDDWVHDSYAGFIGKFEGVQISWARLNFGNIAHIAAEPQRYVRWRGLYCGGNDQLNAQQQEGGSGQRRMA